ncbi:hypothetical protein TIFTF001_016903 [Ficus carica]|uniref:Uncharacterized protein n=1 Tax=Ficus carica TaxID=3494 RepID=A0AA88AKB6_FICCA|nr:hypothetical protein TIFTF001_016903 [Ficus carica]
MTMADENPEKPHGFRDALSSPPPRRLLRRSSGIKDSSAIPSSSKDGHSKKVTKAELESTFTSNTLVGPDNDLIRLASLYCLENKIIGGQQTVQVSLHNWKLAEDIDLFNTYPGGAPSYKETIGPMQRAVIRKKYGITSFPYSLTAWAFEILPALSANGYATLTFLL